MKKKLILFLFLTINVNNDNNMENSAAIADYQAETNSFSRVSHYEMQLNGNNNPFNLKRSDNNDWKGKIYQNDGKYEKFYNEFYGTRAGIMLLKGYYERLELNTIYSVITKYAPNNEAYIKKLSHLLGINEYQQLGKEEFKDLIYNIYLCEGGKNEELFFIVLEEFYN